MISAAFHTSGQVSVADMNAEEEGETRGRRKIMNTGRKERNVM